MNTAVNYVVTFNLSVQSTFNVQSQDAIMEIGRNLQINSLFRAAYFNSMKKDTLFLDYLNFIG
jgi:hypothetical protein